MAEEILINVTSWEVRAALLENGALQEIHIERRLHPGLLGNIYKGKVTRLLPGIQAAFVDIGLSRLAFIHIKDVPPYKEEGDIRDLLYPGKDLIVQVYKNPLGSKGARLTMKLTLPSRYLVLTPGINEVIVSQKITNEAERLRLFDMLKPSQEGGYIIRTAAKGARSDEIEADKALLKKSGLALSLRAKKAKSVQLVHEEIPIIRRVLRDLAGPQIEKIRVDDLSAVKDLKEFAHEAMPSLVDRIEYVESPDPIFDIYSVEEEINKSLQRKVLLKSGGYLIFDQTEAITTIDVNTGSNSRHGIIEETIFRTNCEAIQVIAREVRLRNLGGIIIIDFIDMIQSQHKSQLLPYLTKAMEKDNARIEISTLSSLGLVQMTRRRTRESLEHILCVTCPLCKRQGYIKSIETICYDIFRKLKRMTKIHPRHGFLIIAAKEIEDALSQMLAECESTLGRRIKLQVDASYKQENYDILLLEEKD